MKKEQEEEEEEEQQQQQQYMQERQQQQQTIDFNLFFKSSPYRLFPPPSRCGLRTIKSHLSIPIFTVS